MKVYHSVLLQLWSRYPVCIYPVLVFQKKRAPKLAKYWKRCNPITLLTLSIHGFTRHSSGVRLKSLSWLAHYLLGKQNSNWGREELILSILHFYQYKKTHSKGDNLSYVCVTKSRNRVSKLEVCVHEHRNFRRLSSLSLLFRDSSFRNNSALDHLFSLQKHSYFLSCLERTS